MLMGEVMLPSAVTYVFPKLQVIFFKVKNV